MLTKFYFPKHFKDFLENSRSYSETFNERPQTRKHGCKNKTTQSVETRTKQNNAEAEHPTPQHK